MYDFALSHKHIIVAYVIEIIYRLHVSLKIDSLLCEGNEYFFYYIFFLLDFRFFIFYFSFVLLTCGLAGDNVKFVFLYV